MRIRAKDPLSVGALTVWRRLRDEGGYWTAGEVAELLLPGAPRQKGAITCARWLMALSLRKHVAHSTTQRRVPAYGVTARCVVPEGESLTADATEGAAA